MGIDTTTIIDYVNDIFEINESALKYFYKQLFKQYNPDINGYTLVFMLPPDLSGWDKDFTKLYSQDGPSFVFDTSKFVTFAAIDFTPPTHQVNTEKVSSRTGAIPYVTEVTNTEQCSITYIENSNIDIYHFHHMWIEYMRAVVDGFVSPASKYLDPTNLTFFGAIDYAASIYTVRYLPNLRDIRYINKSIGVFPQSLPSKELVGQKSSNELTTLPFTYFVSGYREATWREQNHWLIKEFNDLVIKIF